MFVWGKKGEHSYDYNIILRYMSEFKSNNDLYFLKYYLDYRFMFKEKPYEKKISSTYIICFCLPLL